MHMRTGTIIRRKATEPLLSPRIVSDTTVAEHLALSTMTVEATRYCSTAAENVSRECYRCVGVAVGDAIILANSRAEAPKASNALTSRSKDTVGSPDSILAIRD